MSEVFNPPNRVLSRRQLLSLCGMGMGSLALTDLLGRSGMLSAAEPSVAGGLPHPVNPMTPKLPTFPGKAKRVIHLFMNGGPSHVDTFDPKPDAGQVRRQAACRRQPADRAEDRGARFPRPSSSASTARAASRSASSSPRRPRCIDDICVIRSMHADVPNHEPSLLLMNCGEARLVRPSMGSWVTYGLGTENQNLPGFIVMCPGGYPIQESQNWQVGVPARRLSRAPTSTPAHRHRKADREHPQPRPSDEQQRPSSTCWPSSIASTSSSRGDEAAAGGAHPVVRAGLPHADRRRPTRSTSAASRSTIREMYGPGMQARQILIARRLLERGVRFVQVWHGAGQPWDNHDDIEVQPPRARPASATRPSARCSRT